MIKKILVILAATTFMVSCATSPESGDGKQERPENVDSEISFEGVSSPNDDPFFSEPVEADPGEQAAQPAEEVEMDMPAPTPEPSVVPDTSTFAEETPVQEEYEEPAPVEEDTASSYEAPAPTPKPKKSMAAKKPASIGAPDAMRTPDSDCSLRSTPGASGARLGVAKKGRKIWTENHNSGWFKVYRKKGHAFVSKSCF